MWTSISVVTAVDSIDHAWRDYIFTVLCLQLRSDSPYFCALTNDTATWLTLSVSRCFLPTACPAHAIHTRRADPAPTFFCSALYCQQFSFQVCKHTWNNGWRWWVFAIVLLLAMAAGLKTSGVWARPWVVCMFEPPQHRFGVKIRY